MSSFFFRPRLFLPTLTLACVFSLGLQTHKAWDSLKSGALWVKEARLGVTPVHAATPEASDAAHTAEKPKTAASPSADKKAEDEDPHAAQKKRSRDEVDQSMSRSELDLMKNLAARREQLEQRNKSLDAREALIRVTEQRVEQKIKELETLKSQVQTLLGQASASQQAQIENLVKIYETMKPKEAARIFETLELPVLMGVVQKMKPQRVAAVMAEMPPEKAKEITIAMTKQDQLPQISP